MIFIGAETPFLGGLGLLYKIVLLNYFFKGRTSYHFKDYEHINLRAFEFLIIEQKYLQGEIKN